MDQNIPKKDLEINTQLRYICDLYLPITNPTNKLDIYYSKEFKEHMFSYDYSKCDHNTVTIAI